MSRGVVGIGCADASIIQANEAVANDVDTPTKV